jgi:hypothetical protein
MKLETLIGLKSLLTTLDKAIELGLNSAYPTVFQVPPPEGGVQWKAKVKLGAKLFKTAAKDIAGAAFDQWRKDAKEATEVKNDKPESK